MSDILHCLTEHHTSLFKHISCFDKKKLAQIKNLDTVNPSLEVELFFFINITKLGVVKIYDAAEPI